MVVFIVMSSRRDEITYWYHLIKIHNNSIETIVESFYFFFVFIYNYLFSLMTVKERKVLFQ